MNIECKFACPFDTYKQHDVQPTAATNVENSRFINWVRPTWQQGQPIETHIPAGCLLKVFNDGKELKIERMEITGNRDITCVGPDDPLCPDKQGYYLKPMTINGTKTEEARKR